MGYPRHAALFSLIMQAQSNSYSCLRYRTCEPVGGQSVWGSFNPTPNPQQQQQQQLSPSSKPTIMAVANTDSMAFFHDLAVGGESDMSGMVSMMGAIKALSNLPLSDISAMPNQLLFAFFTSEAFGNIGSTRFIHDINNFTCQTQGKSQNSCEFPWKTSLNFQNIPLNNTWAVLQAKQVSLAAGRTGNGSLYYHFEKSSGINHATRVMIEALLAADSRQQQPTTTASVSLYPASDETPGIPPSSAESFVLNNNTIGALVITDHSEAYLNPYYQSRFDNGVGLTGNSSDGGIYYTDGEKEIIEKNAGVLCYSSKLLATTLYLLASIPDISSFEPTQSYFDSIPIPDSVLEVDCDWVWELYTCVTSNISCDLAKPYLGLQGIGTYSHYVSIFNWNYNIGVTEKLVHDLLANLTAVNRSAEKCSKNSDCSTQGWSCIGGECINSGVYYHDAYSTAFEYDGSYWSIIDPTKPTYTESYWNTLGVTVFVEDSPISEALIFMVGLLVAAASFLAAWAAKKYLYLDF